MNLEEMKQRKKELGYTYGQIAERSGVPLGTVQKVFGGITESPRYDTLQALEQVFRKPFSSVVCEAKAAYYVKQQGEYTLEDYYALPEERRVELIDGVFYDMTSPYSVHQLVAAELYFQIASYIKGKKGECVPFIAPADVQLDCDNSTMLEPDVFVVCDRSKILEAHIYGAPDFIIEVISKSTKKKDMFLKLNKYMNAGVREYWMVDPMKRNVAVYDFENEEYPVIYGFDAKVPVGIFKGECEVDFQEIYEYVKFLL